MKSRDALHCFLVTRHAVRARSGSGAATPLALAVVLAASGCGGSPAGTPGDGGADAADARATDADTGTERDARQGVGDGASNEVFVYTHSRDTLFQFDPRARVLSTIGTFDCITPTSDPADSADGVTDLAIDRDGTMFGVGRVGRTSALIRVDPATARCTRVGMVTLEGVGVEVQGLSFVPAGTFSPASESLMAMGVSGSYLQIDPSTAVATRVGVLGGGQIDTRGGDFVSIQGGATYTIDNNGGAIYTFDPATGAVRGMVLAQGVLGDGWGMGYWGGVVYAFTFMGRIIAINPSTGLGTEVPIANPPAGLSFRGAAVTTVAPLTTPG